MKKNIISLKEFIKRRNIWERKLFKSKIIKNLSKKLYIESDKHNLSYLHSWFGEPILQTPDDIITQQELIFKTKPEVIIETGVCWGGSTLLYNLLSKELPIKKIIGIDIFIPNNLRKRLEKKCGKKLLLINGDSTDTKIVERIKKITKKFRNFYIHLDSNHTFEHVYKELKVYSKFLKKNNYIIASDTIVNEIPKQLHRPRVWNKKNNPMIAVNKFIRENPNFIIDKKVNYKQLISSNPNAYIKKIK